MTPRRRRSGREATSRTGEPRAVLLAVLLALAIFGCGMGDDVWFAEEWNVTATTTDDHVLVSATIVDVHGDFIHMSIRKVGHDNGYTIERSPSPDQPERDWSRVHHWFGELHPDTYLEGRIDDGSGDGPRAFHTYTFELPRDVGGARQNFPDSSGGEHEYITRGYSYADGNYQHPTFDAGEYEIEIYAWYTGKANDTHPAADGSEGVQYIHHEQPLTSTVFVIE